MPTTFRPYEPDQLLLAPDVRDWLAEGHLAYHVSDLVDGLNLTAFYAPYEPRRMVKVLLYGYATRMVSSRRIARKLEEDMAFRVLGAGNFPSHRTLCEFRRRHLEDFKGMFVKVVRVAREMGRASFGKLSRDGTKVRATASKRKAMSDGRMGAEKRRPEWERKPKGGQPYKRAYGEPEDKAQSTFTDPDRSIMKTSVEGFQPCDNAQVAVDGEPPLLVATELTSNASDQGVMVGLLDAVKDRFDAQPERGLADAGDGNKRDLLELAARGIDGYVAPGREGNGTWCVWC